MHNLNRLKKQVDLKIRKDNRLFKHRVSDKQLKRLLFFLNFETNDFKPYNFKMQKKLMLQL